MKQLIYIAVGGAMGAVLRYLMVMGVHLFANRHFPYGTLLVNILGSFILGFLSIVLLEQMLVSIAVRNAMTIGLLGAFTTFSTFSVDTILLLESGHLSSAIFNVLLSVLCCLIAAWAGINLGRQF